MPDEKGKISRRGFFRRIGALLAGAVVASCVSLRKVSAEIAWRKDDLFAVADE